MKHCFFGLECEIDRDLSDFSNLEKALTKKGWDFQQINFVSQIHSNRVLVIDEVKKIHGRNLLPKADAIVTNVKNLAIGVVTADCAPLILKDEKNLVLAVVHAGWRGAKSGIIENSVKKMEDLGAKTSEIKVFLGPMIHQKSYQVDLEFYHDFLSDDKENSEFFVDDVVLNKFLFDLVGFIKKKLRLLGLENIEDFEVDTYENYEKFASYRKACHLNKKSGGRNISIAMID